MSEQTIVLTVTVDAAAKPEWFVEIMHKGRVDRLGAKLGEPITVPAGAVVARYGPVETPTLNLSHSIDASPPK